MKIEITTITELTDKLSELARKGYHVTIENSYPSPGWMHLYMYKHSDPRHRISTMVTVTNGEFENFEEIFQNMIDELNGEEQNNET